MLCTVRSPSSANAGADPIVDPPPALSRSGTFCYATRCPVARSKTNNAGRETGRIAVHNSCPVSRSIATIQGSDLMPRACRKCHSAAKTVSPLIRIHNAVPHGITVMPPAPVTPLTAAWMTVVPGFTACTTTRPVESVASRCTMDESATDHVNRPGFVKRTCAENAIARAVVVSPTRSEPLFTETYA